MRIIKEILQKKYEFVEIYFNLESKKAQTFVCAFGECCFALFYPKSAVATAGMSHKSW